MNAMGSGPKCNGGHSSPGNCCQCTVQCSALFKTSIPFCGFLERCIVILSVILPHWSIPLPMGRVIIVLGVNHYYYLLVYCSSAGVGLTRDSDLRCSLRVRTWCLLMKVLGQLDLRSTLPPTALPRSAC